MADYNKYILFVAYLIISWQCSDTATIRIATDGSVHGFDPIHNTGIYEFQVYNQIYETLLRLDSDYQTIRPNLVQQWTVEADNQTYRFSLHPDIRFQDGHLLTAWDVLYTLDRYHQEKSDWLLRDIIENTIAVDSLTFEIHLKKIFAPFLYCLCSPSILVIQSKLSDAGTRGRNGTGPYFLYRLTSDGKIVLHQNTFYRKPLSPVKRISFVPFANDEDMSLAIENGDVDIIYMISGYVIDRLKWTGRVNYIVNKPVNTIYIGFNNQQPPFNDRRVRQTFLYAFNIPKIVYNSNRSNALPAHGPLPPVYDYLETISQAQQDIERARTLLAETGLNMKSNDFRFFMTTGRYNLVELLNVQLRPLGINLQVEMYNGWDEQTAAIMSERAQMFRDGYDSDVIGDPWYFLWTLFYSKSPQNSMRYNNPQVDSLLCLAETKYNQSERNQIYKKIVSIIVDETPAIFLNHVIPHFAVDSEKISHISVSPYQILDFTTIKLNE